jgi:hypothetical protein
MSNRASSFPAAPPIPPMHRYGGVLTSMPELPMHALGDAYFVEGSATVLSMPAWPKGPPILLHIIGNPTFVHSSKLLMPGRQNYTFSPGDSAWLLPLGDGVWRVITISRADGIPFIPSGMSLLPAPQGRLTLTPGTAETTSDVATAGSVLYAPRDGNLVTLFDAATGRWVPTVFAETAASLSGLAGLYDIFGYRNGSGAFAMETLAWTDDANRATAIAKQDGIDVKSGDPTRRLLGTIGTVSSGVTADTKLKRDVSNRHNEVPRNLLVTDPAISWTYSNPQFRQANGNAANQFEIVLCMPRIVAAELVFSMSNSTTFGGAIGGIGINSTSTDSSTTKYSAQNPTVGGSFFGKANFAGYLPAGRTRLVWLENSQPNSGVTTWYGTVNGAVVGGNYFVSGLSGMVLN